MQLQLDDADLELLRDILNNYIRNTRMEIADTDSGGFRDMLHASEDRAKSLLERLNA